MFIFPKQEVYNISGIRVGGQMNIPAKMVGTIFYKNQKLFLDRKCSNFNRKIATSVIEDVEKAGRAYGIQSMLDVFAESKQDMIERIDFICENTDMPFMVDSTDAKVRMHGTKYAEEIGVVDKLIYNSINAGIKEPELDFLKASKVNTAIVLAFNPVDNTLKGRIDLLSKGSKLFRQGLIGIAKKAGISRILIDTGVTPLGDGAGVSCHALIVVKSKFRLPTGNGIHNVVSGLSWKALKCHRRFIDNASHVAARMLGADFLMYGPCENAGVLYPVMAFTESLIAESLVSRGLKVDAYHPYSKLLSDMR